MIRQTSAERRSGEMRIRQARLLVTPEARAIRWRPLLGIVPVSFLIAYAGMHDPGSTRGLHMPYAGMALAVWAGFLFDDVASSTIRNVPTPILLRRSIRVILALPVLSLVWLGLLVYADVWQVAGTLTTDFAAQVAVALGFGALGVVVMGEDRGGLFAAAGSFGVFVVVPLLMRGGILAPQPAHDTWTYFYGRWIATSVVAAGVLVLASRDPAARGGRAAIRLLTGRARSAVP